MRSRVGVWVGIKFGGGLELGVQVKGQSLGMESRVESKF